MNSPKDHDGKDSQELAQERTAWAEDRTDWAEDRTILANERTFAGWMRTGLAAIGLGLAFRAVFGAWEPSWLPRAVASIFVLAGIFIIYQAQAKGCEVIDRLNSHSAKPIKGVNLRTIALMMGLGGASLLAGMWIFQ